MRRVSIVAALAALIVAALPAAGLANGDRASDVLLSDPLYVPLEAPSDESVEKLRNVIERSRAAGQPVRVALIHSAQDLALVSNLFGHPAEYANYLAQQVSRPAEPGARGNREALLVVMPAGYGTANVPRGVDRELRTIELPADATPDELAAAAGYGVQQLAKATGREIPAVFDKPDAGGGGALVPILIVLALVAVIAALVVMRVRASSVTREE